MLLRTATMPRLTLTRKLAIRQNHASSRSRRTKSSAVFLLISRGVLLSESTIPRWMFSSIPSGIEPKSSGMIES